MNREEQIEALENFLSFNTVVNDWLMQDQIHRVAEQIIDEGWHKQSDDERVERLPKKVKISLHGTTDWNTRCRCPVCNKDLFDGQKFCSECGQRIDWGRADMNREVTLAKCPVCKQLHPADEKCECQKRRCVNCGNNKRTYEGNCVSCRCEYDGHDIGYVECFEGWCRHWRKDREI